VGYSTGDIDETCFKLTNEEDREEVRIHVVDTIEEYEDSSDSWDEETIANSDEFLATGGN
jgi:hypothetical protein